jgi:Flp pilus assembly protein TadG
MRRLALPRLAKSLSSDNRAIAAVEFALIAPALIALTAGGYEMSRAVSQARQLTTLAGSIATMLTTNTSGAVTYLSLHYAFDSAMVTFPTVLSDSFAKGIAWNKDIGISMAGVSFTPTVTGCTSHCTYKANIVWTGGSVAGGQPARACGTNPVSAADTSAPSTTTLPADLFDTVTTPSGVAAPNFVVVVDVGYTWTPLLFSKLFGAITLKRSAYLAPRYVAQIKYSAIAGDDGFGAECSGF